MAERRPVRERAAETGGPERTYPMRAAAKLTGISPDLLRAWERRYGLVAPVRTPGGTRRYRASDLERLRLVKAAVDAGHRISGVAQLGRDELELLAARNPLRAPSALDAALDALARLDAAEAERLAALQLAALGPAVFARDFALPLLDRVGAAWRSSGLCAASEHLGTALLRSLLGSALRPTRASRGGPRIVFGTPPGERHEIGLLAAAVVALGAGADVAYLGPDLPVAELLRAVELAGAAALTLALVAIPIDEASRAVRAARDGLPEDAELWLGGPRAFEIELPAGAQRFDSLDAVERTVEILALRTGLRSPA